MRGEKTPTTIRQEEGFLVVTQELRCHGHLFARAVDLATLSEQFICNLLGPNDHVDLAECLVLVDRPVLSSPFGEFEPEVAPLAIFQLACAADEQLPYRRMSEMM